MMRLLLTMMMKRHWHKLACVYDGERCAGDSLYVYWMMKSPPLRGGRKSRRTQSVATKAPKSRVGTNLAALFA